MLYREIKHLLISQWSLIGLVVMLNLVGCTVSAPDTESNSGIETKIGSVITTVMPSITPTITSTTIPSGTPTETLTVTSAPSSTPTPVIPTPTVTTTTTPTPWATLPPLPTIAPQQRGQEYTELINSNGNCELPCWWGFELGKTSVAEVRQFYETFDASIVEQTGGTGISALYVKFIEPEIEDGTQVRHVFLAQDDIVIEVEAQVRRQPDYQIEPLLQELGQPSEIWMWTIPEPYEGILPASFRLYYPEQGVLVAYAVASVRVDDAVQVCFDELGSVILGLWDPSIWDPDGTKGFVERANETSELGLDRDFHPIEEVSNWNVEQFYTILADPTHSDCLETPSNLWSPP